MHVFEESPKAGVGEQVSEPLVAVGTRPAEERPFHRVQLLAPAPGNAGPKNGAEGGGCLSITPTQGATQSVWESINRLLAIASA